MKTLLKYLSAGALSIVSLGAIANAPVSAASLTGATIGGSAPSDYKVYDVSGSNTIEIVNNPAANVQKVLDGNASSPTGNVELAASSEQAGFDFTKNTSLQGKLIGDKSITLSSLTSQDWFGIVPNKSYGASNFANTWFNEFITKAGYGSSVGTDNAKFMYNSFGNMGGFEASSDPNISYVNQDDITGLISIGLAGHYDLKTAYTSNPKYASFAAFLPNGFQASEVVKYNYDNQVGYLYSFKATRSGLFAADDGVSHNGNYEVTLRGARPVPVPAAFVGIAIAGAIGAAKLKRSKVTIKA